MFHRLFSSSSATRNLFIYNICVGLSLTIAANFVFIDRLLLRLNIDLGFFGTIKSMMFLLPAALYQLLLPLLRKLNRDVEVCAVSYVLRTVFPLLLPFCAILLPSSLMTLCSFILLPAGMLFAVFANNALMKIYREVLYPTKYNYYTGFMNMFLSLPGLLLSLPISWLLDRFNGLGDRDFFLLFGGLQFFTFCFEIPAILALRKVKARLRRKNVSTAADPEAKPKNRSLLSAPYRDPRYRTLLTLGLLHRIAAGLSMAYLTVYFLEVLHLGMTTLAVIGLAMSSLGNLLLPSSGKLADRFGYERFFIVLSGGMLFGMILFCSFWESLFVLPLFALLAWDGSGSLFGSLETQGEYSASGKLAASEWLDAAVASYSIAQNGGMFLGLIAASALYASVRFFLPENLSRLLHMYYILTLPVFLLIFLTAYRFLRLSRRRNA